MHSRFLSPIAPVVDCSGHADHYGWEKVARHIVVLFTRVFTFKDLHKHKIQLDTFQTHPGEGRQEKEMEDPRNDGTSDLSPNKDK